jgi:hypothetical protein
LFSEKGLASSISVPWIKESSSLSRNILLNNFSNDSPHPQSQRRLRKGGTELSKLTRTSPDPLLGVGHFVLCTRLESVIKERRKQMDIEGN